MLQVRKITDERASGGYRRVTAKLNREVKKEGFETWVLNDLAVRQVWVRIRSIRALPLAAKESEAPR